ncbi:unnamed protein product [Sphagnum tenellum]
MGFHLWIYGLFSTFSLSFFLQRHPDKFVQWNSFKEKSWMGFMAHGGQWRDEQEATRELGASYVKKLFGILFSFSKTNIQSPKFASSQQQLIGLQVFCAKCFEWTWSLEMADGDYGIMHLEVLNPSDEFFLNRFLQALSREPKFNHTSSIAWSDCPP